MEQRRIASSRILNGLSVDVEDWFQVGAFENTIDRADWNGLALRVADNVKFVLDLFDACEVKATFFVVGQFRFGKVEIDRAALDTLLAEQGGQLRQRSNRAHRLVVTLPEGGATSITDPSTRTKVPAS